MKKFIKFDDRNHYKIGSFVLTAFFAILFVSTFSETIISVKIIYIVLALIFSILCLNASRLGITFDYKSNVFRAYVPSLHECCKLKMNEIKQIEIVEIPKERKKRFFGTFTKSEAITGIISEPNFVYRNGKIFNIVITKIDNTQHTIFYGMLYKSRSKKRVQMQEDKINEAIQFFIEMRLKKQNLLFNTNKK